MKIIGFAQLRNECVNGHLQGFVDSMRVCDEVYIYDQASTDGSFNIYRAEGYKVHYSLKNNFYNEMSCKEYLLRWILKDHPDADWILWLDGDTLLDKRLWERGALEDLCNSTCRVDHICFLHYNLWRSDTYYRTDNKYHELNGTVAALWKVNHKLSFGNKPGLHVRNFPFGLYSEMKTEYALIHRGFGSDESLLTRLQERFSEYVKRYDSPWHYFRAIDESTLAVNRILNPEEILTEQYCQNDINSRILSPMIHQYCNQIEQVINCSLKDAYEHIQEWML